MKSARYLPLLLALLLGGCETDATKPPVVVVAPTGTATAAQIAAQDALIEKLKGIARDQQDLAENAAGAVYGAQDANKLNPTGLPKDAVDAQLAEAESSLPPPTPEQKLAKERDNARIMAGELLAVKAEMGLKITENEKLKASNAANEKLAKEAEAKAVAIEAAAVKERAEAAAKLQKQFDAMTAKIKAAQDEAKNAVMLEQVMWLNRIGAAALGLAILSVGLAAFMGGPTALRAVAPFSAIALLAALACFGLAQVIGAAWFKWAVLGSLASIVGVGAWWVLKGKQAIQRSKEADEAEETLKQIIPVLDNTPIPEIANKLSSAMNDPNKALIHELRAETKREKAVTP